MTPYIINAWLDCSSPHITLNDRETGELLVHYNKTDVISLFQEGEIALDELQSNDDVAHEELIISLLLFKSTHTIEQQLKSAYLSLRMHDPASATEPDKPTFQQQLQNLVSFPATTLQQTG